MKARMAFILLWAISFSLSMPLQAGDAMSGDPRQYKPVDRKVLREHVKSLQNGTTTLKDLRAISAQIHGVSVIPLPDSSPDILPASTRPQGKLQLDKVIHPSD